jgi:hypothetical protein
LGRSWGCPPLSEISQDHRGEFHERLLDADAFEDVSGKVTGGDPDGRKSRPKLRRVSRD